MRAKEIIEKSNGKAIVRKNTKTIKNEGCGYVVIATGNSESIVELLNRYKIRYVGYEIL